MVEEKKKSGLRRLGQLAALFLFLVGLPAVSWYYLSTGLQYRKQALQELGDHGRIPDFSLTNYLGDTLHLEDVKGKLVVASFLSLDSPALSDAFGETLRKLHEQFDHREDVVFIQHLIADSVAVDRITAFADQYGLADAGQCFFLTGGRPPFEQLARDGYHLPLDANTPLQEASFFALADTNAVIRQYYDVRHIGEVKRLVAHIAIILPMEKTENPVVRREPEK